MELVYHPHPFFVLRVNFFYVDTESLFTSSSFRFSETDMVGGYFVPDQVPIMGKADTLYPDWFGLGWLQVPLSANISKFSPEIGRLWATRESWHDHCFIHNGTMAYEGLFVEIVWMKEG